MGPDGNILAMLEVKKLSEKEQKKYIPIPDIESVEVHGMNRAERRRWYRENKNRKHV